MSDKLKDILNPPVKGGVKRIKKLLDKYLISKEEKKDITREIVNLEANLAPKYPRCFIWYDLGNDGNIGEPFPLHYVINGHSNAIESQDIITSNVIMFTNKFINFFEDVINIDSFLNRHKGKYKEISLKEYMGECPEGDFGIIKIPLYCDPHGQVIYTLVEDEFSKKRINYLKNNVENKYNTIRLYGVNGVIDGYRYVNAKSYTIDKENNCIIFEIEAIPPFNMITQVKVSLDAKVVNK